MNVPLAEADVPYEQLIEMETINPEFYVQTWYVLGANDVVNPQARNDPSSPLYGMPVLNVEEATTVFVKRGLSAGYAGIKNILLSAPTPQWCLATPRRCSADWRRNCANWGRKSQSGLSSSAAMVPSVLVVGGTHGNECNAPGCCSNGGQFCGAATAWPQRANGPRKSQGFAAAGADRDPTAVYRSLAGQPNPADPWRCSEPGIWSQALSAGAHLPGVD